MKTPYYETAPGATAALLEAGLFVDCDLYTFILPGAIGGVSQLLYCAGPIDVAADGSYWPANEVTFDQDKAKAVAHWKIGLDVDQWQVVAAPRNVDILTGAAYPDTIGTAPFLAAVRAGALDGAELQVDRAFAANWQQTAPGQGGRLALQPTGIVTIFYGRVAELDAGRSQVVITIDSHLKLLANQMPRRLYQAPCIHTLFGTGCGLIRSRYGVAGAIAGVSASGNVVTASVSPPSSPANSGTFALGALVMNSGASEGFARQVVTWAAGSPSTFTLRAPFPLGVAPGDAFTAYPGCDKRFSTCGQFANQVNFGGEIGIPVPETAV